MKGIWSAWLLTWREVGPQVLVGIAALSVVAILASVVVAVAR